MKLARALRIASALAVGASSATAQRPGAIPLDEGWKLAGEGARIEPYQGMQSIRLRTGQAIRRGVMLRDGTIEFDLAMEPHRSFVYLRFRMADDGETEEIYSAPTSPRSPTRSSTAPCGAARTTACSTAASVGRPTT